MAHNQNHGKSHSDRKYVIILHRYVTTTGHAYIY